MFVAILALAIGFLIERRPAPVEPPDRVVRSTIPPPPGTALAPSFDTKGLALSPDGRALAFVADGTGTPQIWIRELSSSTARVVAGSDGASYPFWSPDGQSLAFFAGGELLRIDLRGGSPRPITGAPYGRGGSWGRGGTILFAPLPQGASIMMVSADGGEVKPVTKLDPRTEITHRWPQFLPDGKHFLYIADQRKEGSVGVGQLRVGSIEDAETRTLIDDSTNALYCEPGWLIHGRGPYLFASRFDAEELSISGDPIPIVPESTAYWGPKTFIPFAASNDGTLVYLPAPSRESELVFLSRDGRREESLGKAEYYAGSRISPDGMKVAYETTGSGDRHDLWVRDLEGGRADRVTDPDPSTAPITGCTSCDPVWSPDSTAVAYGCQGAGAADLCVKSLVDGSPARRVMESPNWETAWSWLPDGSAMVVSEQDPTTKIDLLLVTLTDRPTTTPLLVTPANEGEPAVSPDGHWVAYVSDVTGRAEVYVRGLGPGDHQWQISTDGGGTPRWRGQEIVYVAANGSLMAVPVETAPIFRPGQPSELFRIPSGGTLEDVSPDGTRILLDLSTDSPTAVPFQLVTNWRALVEQ